MSWIEAVILGIIQGLTEFLPVSSSGHLTIAGTLFGMKSGEEILAFTTLLHVATVCSTIVVLWGEIKDLFKGFFAFRRNEETLTVAKLLLSALPVGIIGLFFKDQVEAVFGQGLFIVGCMLLLTAVLLMVSYFTKPNVRKEQISFRDALIIGVAQACAVMPGLSRSGTTIATGIVLGNKKERVAKFSFLMVLIPVLGEALLDALKLLKGDEASAYATMSPVAMWCGFAAAFVAGAVACKWMIGIVKRGKLIYFAYYCMAIGTLAIIYSFFN
ncbi:undecaprenyl-diphosphate phosphatase [Tannerella forsythia]|uniref:Undecaprenyl-diphosphatase n=1 Tax=Tannerella forsythia TaxID=28112 RepID=A0A3P1XVM1_TANFO|nr:undecaprenyl-diphosphate phosphatase [Tannerella forsythia]RRD62016.1 undecaprenyl-diphosphate phosphatase [Tannerella forsythia]